MKVRIYQPAKTAMQSGKANTAFWLVEPLSEQNKFIDPIMGWTGSGDTAQQLHLKFSTKEAAIEYANREGLEFTVIEPKVKKPKIRAYAENFTNPRL